MSLRSLRALGSAGGCYRCATVAETLAKRTAQRFAPMLTAATDALERAGARRSRARPAPPRSQSAGAFPVDDRASRVEEQVLALDVSRRHPARRERTIVGVPGRLLLSIDLLD